MDDTLQWIVRSLGYVGVAVVVILLLVVILAKPLARRRQSLPDDPMSRGSEGHDGEKETPGR